MEQVLGVAAWWCTYGLMFLWSLCFKRKTTTNVYIKKNYKNSKKTFPFIHPVCPEQNGYWPSGPCYRGKGRTGGEAIALLTLNQVKVM